MSNDTVDGSVGEDARGVAVGKGITQQSNRAGDINLSSNENALWFKMLEMAADIRDLVRQLDDLPNRVRRLEDVEVVVKPGPEVVIRPYRQEANRLPDRLLLILMLVAVFVVLAIVTLFVVWVIRNA